MRLYKRVYIIVLLLWFTCITSTIHAQELFYRVYQYETSLGGHLEANLWNTYIPNSNLQSDFFDKSISNKNLWAHSVEAEYGITDHLSLAVYADFEDPQQQPLKFVQSKIEARYRFKERYDNFINTAVYVEYYWPDHAYSNSQEMEARLILDKDLNDFRIVANPTLSKYISGDKDKYLQFGLSAGLYYRRIRFIQPGIEYNANYTEKTGAIFPAVTLHPSPVIDWNLGVGFGLNNNSDGVIVKSIFSVDLMAIRPTKLFKQKAGN